MKNNFKLFSQYFNIQEITHKQIFYLLFLGLCSMPLNFFLILYFCLFLFSLLFCMILFFLFFFIICVFSSTLLILTDLFSQQFLLVKWILYFLHSLQDSNLKKKNNTIFFTLCKIVIFLKNTVFFLKAFIVQSLLFSLTHLSFLCCQLSSSDC